MANPRQRRKSRSSTYRPVSHSKHAKRNLKKTPPIRGPKALQESWDNKKTVRQNYTRLGLAASLDPFTHGGIEQSLGPSADHPQSVTPSIATAVDSVDEDMPVGFGRIIRDAAGRVVGMELNEAEPKADVDLDDIDNVDARIDPDVRRKWASEFTKGNTGVISNEAVINELERMSALRIPSSGVSTRHASGGQLKFLEALVKKHGGNVRAMAADLKLNPEQRTIGQIRRALKNAGFLAPQLDFESTD